MTGKKRIRETEPVDQTRTTIRVQLLVDEPFVVEWAKIPDELTFVAIDANGDVWGFGSKPIPTDDVWDGDGREIDPNEPDVAPKMIGRIGYGVANWRDTLAERPGVDNG